MELALDTSSQEISIALSDKGTVISSYTWPTSHNETVELLPRITHLLEQNKVTMEQLDAVYVAHGPGSFNSLRVGLSIAKGLAYSLKILIIGLSTLEILAYPFALTKLPIYPVLRVSNDRIATAQYKNVESWQCLQQEHLTTVELLCQQITEPVVFCGEINEEICEVLKKNLGSKAILPKLPNIGHPKSITRLGWERLSNGKHDNVFTLQPHYLREPHITKSKKRLPFAVPGQLPVKEEASESNGSQS